MAAPIETRSEATEEYLLDLYFAVRGPEFSMLPLPQEQRNAIIRQQFEWQYAAYREAFPTSGYEVILSQGEPAGRIWVDRSPKMFWLVDIAIHPKFQRQGIASALLARLQTEAAAAGAAIGSSVNRFNTPSIRLHQRLGFQITSESDMELEYVWRPAV